MKRVSDKLTNFSKIKHERKIMKKRIKSEKPRARDLNILAGIRGECQMGTIKNTQNKKRYNRKKLSKISY